MCLYNLLIEGISQLKQAGMITAAGAKDQRLSKLSEREDIGYMYSSSPDVPSDV